MSSEWTLRDVWALVGRLDAVSNLRVGPLMWTCPRCKAQVGKPCRRPSGEALQGDQPFHVRRSDKYAWAANRAPLSAWRKDPAPPREWVSVEETIREIRRSALYRAAKRAGVLRGLP